MTPNIVSRDCQQPGVETYTTDEGVQRKILPPREYEINWINTIVHIFLAVTGIMSFYTLFAQAKLLTILFTIVMTQAGMIGTAAGSHRYYTHQSFKAKLPLRVLFVVLQTLTFQESIFAWARNHRLHHKYPDDDADPYNPARGFFFAHMGWMCVKRHPKSVEKSRQVDMRDIMSDPVVMFQHRHYLKLVFLVAGILPIAIPMYFWGETYWSALLMNMLRHNLTMHSTLSINSVTHKWGMKPYDTRISPTDTYWLHALTVGESTHNYHHVFPWDYRSSELNAIQFNTSTWVIDLFAKIGWAYDLKTANNSLIVKRVARTGVDELRSIKREGTNNIGN